MRVLEDGGGGNRVENYAGGQNQREGVNDDHVEPQGKQKMLKRRKQENGKL